MSKTIRNILYNGEVILDFDTFRHQYLFEGQMVKSVTKILGVINKPALVNWAANSAVDYIEEQIEPGKAYDEIELQTMFNGARKNHWQKKVDAGNAGSFIHKWIEDYIKGKKPGKPVNPELSRATERFLEWVEKHKVEFLVSEQVCYSRKYNYAGTLDFICKIDGDMYLGDLKTTSGIYAEYMIQTAAYRSAREEEFPQEKYKGQLILRIDKETGEQEFAIFTDYEWYRKMFVAFLAAQRLEQNLTEIQAVRHQDL